MGTFLSNLPQYLINGLGSSCVYIMMAVGFSLVYASTGIINFAQGEFAAIGALAAYTFSTGLGLPLPLAVASAVLVAGALGVLLERGVIRPLQGKGVLTAIIATIGASIFMKAGARILWPEEAYKVPEFTKGQYNLPGVSFNSQLIWMIVLTATSIAGVYLLMNGTKLGKGLRACAINPEAAKLVGINISLMSMAAFGIAGLLGGMAGLISAPFANYGMGLYLGIKGFTAAIIGGLGDIYGSVLGGLTVGLSEEVIAGFLSVVLGISSGYKDAVAVILLVVVLLFRPQGLVGRGLVEKV